MKSRHLSCIFFSLALGATASAAAIIVEDFEGLSLGDIDGQSGWRVTPQTGRTASVVSGGISYTNGGVSINGGSQSLQVDGAATLGSDPATDFVGLDFNFAASGSTTYFRFLLDPGNTATSHDAFTAIGFSGVDTSGDTGDDLSDDWSRISSAAVILRGANDQLRAYDSSGGRVENNLGSGSYFTGDPFLIVGRVTFDGSGNETVDLLVNPDSTTEPATWTASISTQNLGVTSLGYFGVYVNDSDPGNNAPFRIDGVAVGDSFSEVLAIPEPSTLMMSVLGLVCGALVMRRRR
jgi:hypothetical protein